MLTKEKIIETLRNLPDKFDADELIERIILLDKIEKGVAQSDADDVISDEEMNERLRKWLD